MELIWQMTTMEEKRKLKNISNKCAIRAIESFRPVTLSSLLTFIRKGFGKMMLNSF